MSRAGAKIIQYQKSYKKTDFDDAECGRIIHNTGE